MSRRQKTFETSSSSGRKTQVSELLPGPSPDSTEPTPFFETTQTPTPPPVSWGEAIPVQGKHADENPALPKLKVPSPGSGARLPPATAEQMGSSFNTDFSSVRIHQDGQADAIGAKAYARGENIHFAPGTYNPNSQAGKKLLGHELAHVVQQRQGRVESSGGAMPFNLDSSLERDADVKGERAARGESTGMDGDATGTASAGGPVQGMQSAFSMSKLIKNFVSPFFRTGKKSYAQMPGTSKGYRSKEAEEKQKKRLLEKTNLANQNSLQAEAQRMDRFADTIRKSENPHEESKGDSNKKGNINLAEQGKLFHDWKEHFGDRSGTVYNEAIKKNPDGKAFKSHRSYEYNEQTRQWEGKGEKNLAGRPDGLHVDSDTIIENKPYHKGKHAAEEHKDQILGYIHAYHEAHERWPKTLMMHLHNAGTPFETQTYSVEKILKNDFQPDSSERVPHPDRKGFDVKKEVEHLKSENKSH